MKVNILKEEKLLDNGERKSFNIENKIKIENNLTIIKKKIKKYDLIIKQKKKK